MSAGTSSQSSNTFDDAIKEVRNILMLYVSEYFFCLRFSVEQMLTNKIYLINLLILDQRNRKERFSAH